MKIIVIVLCAILTAAQPAAASDEPPPPVGAAFLGGARAVLTYLRDHDDHHVGVLKFAVNKGGKVDESAGPLNHVLATRLEVALVLVDDVNAPLGHLREASAVAATLPGADHRTPEGRRALFRGRYPTAWGTGLITPDALLTGLASIDDDRRAMTVTVSAVHPSGGAPVEVVRFRASTDPPTLAAAGDVFVTRGGGAYEAADSAARAASGGAADVFRDKENPVALTVEYDGIAQPLLPAGDGFRVREPKEGESVRFVLSKRFDDNKRYGVALVVNGYNTLFRERKPPEHCSKWVLGPGPARLDVRGYQSDESRVAEFQVLSDERSKREAYLYGPEVGVVTMTVFPERPDLDTAGGPPADRFESAEDVVGRALIPEKTPKSASALFTQIRDGSRRGGQSRGLAVEGRAAEARVTPSEVVFGEQPLASIRVVYYRPAP